jgi:deoxyribodipyrimidine photolyase-related protein
MAARTLRLILGDQLNLDHSWFRQVDGSVDYVLMEVRQETDYVLHHIQKICAFFAAMRAFAAELQKRGHRVHYLTLGDAANLQDVSGNIRRLMETHGYDRFEYLLPDEYRLDTQMRALEGTLPCAATAVDTEHFLTTRTEVAEFFRGKKQWRMEFFYQHMRRKHDVLMADGRPDGGRWNYDPENREKYRAQVPPADPTFFGNNVSHIADELTRLGVTSFGSLVPTKLSWPIDQKQSRILLADFVTRLLPHFGRFQDAMTVQSWTLFHSRLSFALNTKMLHPLEVIGAALEARVRHPNKISLPQVERVVRLRPAQTTRRGRLPV